jgi:long-chain acyl-CoA synthetase
MSDQPWLQSYEADVPPSLTPYADITLLDAVRERAAARPDRVAIEFMGAELTYSELERESTALAAALHSIGVRRGDRVALLLPNTPQFVIAQLAVWKLRAIVSPLNPIYTEQELTQALNRTGASAIIVLTRFYELVKRLQPNTVLRHVVATSIKDFLPGRLRVMYTLLKEKKEGDRIELHADDHEFGKLIDRHRSAEPQLELPRPEDTAILLLSGGTTGVPKAVMGAHRAFTWAGRQLRTWLHSILDEWDDSVLIPLPLFHVFGNVGGLGITLLGGNRIVLVPNPRDIDALVKIVRVARPSIVMMVPALLQAMLAHRDVRAGKVDFRSIKGCFSGAAPLLEDTRRAFEQATGGRIVEGYSLTEAMMACLANPVGGDVRGGSVGLPLPDVELRIVDAEHGDRDLPVGETGEVILRAPQVMQGYWENPAETAVALRSAGPGAPWLFTGDLGYIDADGYLYIVDRKKDLMKIGGMQVWPREIEEAIALHAAVADVAVAGIADARKGEVIMAWVVTHDETSVTEAEIRAWCRERLAPYKIPARVEFRATLPRNAAGKLLRRELRDEAQRVGAVEGTGPT